MCTSGKIWDFEIIENILKDFLKEFINNPYLCYTEHGLHALFYTKLYDYLSKEQRHLLNYGMINIYAIQKEYPTAYQLGKGRRQHWDVAVISNPPEPVTLDKKPGYDYLKLFAVFEFGLNEKIKHLQDDIERLSNKDSHVEHPFVIHLYRISGGRNNIRFSMRDRSSDADEKQFVKPDMVQSLLKNIDSKITVYHGIANQPPRKSELCKITKDTIEIIDLLK